MSTDIITMAFKMPPSTNELWGYGKKNVYLTDKGRKYHEHVASMLSQFDINPNINMPVEVVVMTHFSDARKHDIDNIIKILFDSLTMANFWEDDELVHKFSVERGPITEVATIEVAVSPYVSSWQGI